MLLTIFKYQAQGAPHYHISLWIDGAPTVVVMNLRWDSRENNCIPEEESNPELHELISKYHCTSAVDIACEKKGKRHIHNLL